ncbi:MAG TPA: hypothetical protein VKX16_15820 [Chloroflexota bacterium]|nr:hypothetical protein [Chloroflexota bacterium]
MQSVLRASLAASLLVGVASLTIQTPAGAAYQGIGLGSLMHAGPHASPPNVNIVGTDPKAKYQPGHVKVVAVPLSQCSPSNYSGTLTNTTLNPETVTYHGQQVGTIQPGQTVYACVPAAGRYVFGLQSSPKAKLVIVAH